MGSNVQNRLTELENALRVAPRRRLCGDATWARDVSSLAGVYTIWETESGKPVYVGETSGLLARMSDLGRTLVNAAQHDQPSVCPARDGKDRRKGDQPLRRRGAQ